MGAQRPELFRLVLPARHARNPQNIGVNKNIETHQDFTVFHQTLAVNISASRRLIKKL
jgi:hypothetical protein